MTGLRPLGLAVCLALVLPGAAALAKEESKIQILLLPPGGGNGNGNGHGPIGDMRSFLQDPGGLRRFQLHVRGLAPGDHSLLALTDELDPDPLPLADFTVGANGQFNGSFELGNGDGLEAPVDPRGKYLAVNDGDVSDRAADVLVGWLYGVPDDDGPKTKVKELTRLAPDETQNPTGSVDARYDMRPNGKGTFGVMMRGVPPGDYDVCVDGIVVETLTPNPGGSARASFRTHPSNGNGNGGGQGHNKKGMLDFDPRRKLVELKQGDQVYFSGPMLAQIEGLNVCAEGSTALANVTPAGVSASLDVEADCETAFAVSVTGFTMGTYDLLVDGMDRGDLEVAMDGTGSLRFDPTPEPGELLLDFPVTSASAVVVQAQP